MDGDGGIRAAGGQGALAGGLSYIPVTAGVLPAHGQTFRAECSRRSRPSPRKTPRQRPQTPAARDRGCMVAVERLANPHATQNSPSYLDVEQEMWLESRMDAWHVGCADHSVPAPVPTFEHSLAR